MGKQIGIGLLGFLAAGVLSSEASASERRFTYTYGSAVLNPGDVELEPWTTYRTGRQDYFTRMDTRLEFEVGLLNHLQTAWYFNTSAQAHGNETEFEFEGISSEWKYQLSDPVADVIGSALYFELSAGPRETEIETKIILDKRIGNLLLATNLIAEQEWARVGKGTERELTLEFTAGASYFITPAFAVGVEADNLNPIVDGELEHSALYAGPVVSYAAERWWAAASVLPQLPALKGAEPGYKRIYDDNEKLHARVLFGVHL